MIPWRGSIRLGKPPRIWLRKRGKPPVYSLMLGNRTYNKFYTLVDAQSALAQLKAIRK